MKTRSDQDLDRWGGIRQAMTRAGPEDDPIGAALKRALAKEGKP